MKPLPVRPAGRGNLPGRLRFGLVPLLLCSAVAAYAIVRDGLITTLTADADRLEVGYDLSSATALVRLDEPDSVRRGWAIEPGFVLG